MNRTVIVALAALLLVPVASGAKTELGLKGIGGRLSFVSPNDVDATFGLGAMADLGTFTPEIGLEATLDYWSKSEGSGALETKVRDIVLGARTKYRFKVEKPKLKPYAAAGLAIHIFRVELPTVVVFGTPVGGSDTSTKLGVDLAGGLGYAVGEKVDVIGELMYRIVSDYGQFVFSGGVIFWLGD